MQNDYEIPKDHSWIKVGEFWLARHKIWGVVVVIGEDQILNDEVNVYLPTQDRIALVWSTALCMLIIPKQPTDYEIEEVLLKYGTYLKLNHSHEKTPRNDQHSTKITDDY